ncbi:MAG: NAD(P)/FAD-dependent oxidoreductase [Candidatus Heimdallarchaeaceae archaeon]
MKTIVVLGGGFAGIITANKLARKIKKNQAKIILIEPLTYNTYEAGLLLFSFNKKPLSKLTQPMHKVLNKRIQHIELKAKKVEPEKKRIILDQNEEVYYDYLVLATGVHYLEDKIKFSESEKVHHFYSPQETAKLRRALRNFQGGTIVISPTTVPYKCPPAPVEFTLLLDKRLRQRKIRDKTTIKYLYPLSLPFTIPVVAEKINKLFEERDIEFESFSNFEDVDFDNQKLITLEGEEIYYDELVLIPPHVGQQVIKDSGLGDREGYVPTDKLTLKVKGYDDIYAIGDCTDLPTSKSGTVSHFSSDTVVENIKLQLAGKEPTAEYDGKTICFLLTSFYKSYLLYFTYKTPPLKIGLHSWGIYALMKYLFKWMYFKILIKGLM